MNEKLIKIKMQCKELCERGATSVARAFSRTHTIECGVSLIGDCADAIGSVYSDAGYSVQKLRFVSGTGTEGVLLQIAQPEKGWKFEALKTMVGQRLAVWVKFLPVGEDVQIEVGCGRWVDKTLSGLIAWSMFAPLLIVPAIGAWRQISLIDRIDADLVSWIEKNRMRIGAIDV